MRRAGRLRVGQRFAVVAALLALVLTFGVITGVHASTNLAHARATAWSCASTRR